MVVFFLYDLDLSVSILLRFKFYFVFSHNKKGNFLRLAEDMYIFKGNGPEAADQFYSNIICIIGIYVVNFFYT